MPQTTHTAAQPKTPEVTPLVSNPPTSGTLPTAPLPVHLGRTSKARLGNVAGTETVLMLARPTKLELPEAEVRKWFAGLRPVPFLGDKARVWFEDFDVLRNDPDRAPGKAEKPDGPRALQQELRQRIGSEVMFSRAVSFSRRGAK